MLFQANRSPNLQYQTPGLMGLKGRSQSNPSDLERNFESDWLTFSTACFYLISSQRRCGEYEVWVTVLNDKITKYCSKSKCKHNGHLGGVFTDAPLLAHEVFISFSCLGHPQNLLPFPFYRPGWPEGQGETLGLSVSTSISQPCLRCAPASALFSFP